MQWNTGYYEGLHSFANNIATTEGGMHEEGFKKALTNVVNKYGRGKNLLKEKEDNLLGEDIREGLTAIISVKLRNPQFEGQTKTKLGNTEMRSMVEKVTNEKLGDWLEEHPAEAKQIMTKATQASAGPHGRASQARDLTRRKSAARVVGGLPGKLADCSSRNPAESEMFIVEGNSAGGSAKEARDPHIQAILPIRGKILNVERARMDKMLKNDEIQALITAIGRGPRRGVRRREGSATTGSSSWPTPTSTARTSARCCSRSSSARCRELVEAGYVYVAQPPLFRADSARRSTYLKDEAALTRVRGRERRPQARGQPLQGPRRDGLRGARGDDDGPDAALAAAGLGRAGRDRRRGVLHPHGRRRRVAQALHPAERQGRPLPRHLSSTGSRPNHAPEEVGVPDGTQPRSRNIEPIEIQEEMERSFLDYAMSVIMSRALPDVRDGLKPVQRRILYGMYEGGLRPDRNYKKCASAVGDVMGNYHPHGDQSIYDALARMAQDFSLRYPLVDGHGNFGSPDPNDRPAAMRYSRRGLARVDQRRTPCGSMRSPPPSRAPRHRST